MSETITISRDELRNLIDEGVKKGIAGMGDAGQTRILRRVTERKVSLRFIDKRAVIAFKNRGTETRPNYLYDKPDPKNSKEMLLFVDLVLEGAKEGEVLSVNYREFLKESHRVWCKILQTDEKEWTINQGVVRKMEVEEYSSIELDFDVPLDVTGKARFFTVEVPAEMGGPRKVYIHENYVNMA